MSLLTDVLHRTVRSNRQLNCVTTFVKPLEALQGDGRYELTGPDGGWTATLACGFCTGEHLATTAHFMIGCDVCENWYHGPCVGVGKAQADTMDDYLCPHCATAAGKPYAFGPPLPVPRLAWQQAHSRSPAARWAPPPLALARSGFPLPPPPPR